jgi:acetyl-CoA carboxylase carboxyl transferase subunit alpha
MARTYLDFEKPVAELESKLRELRALAEAPGTQAVDLGEEVARLEAKATSLLRTTYERLSPWQKTQVARHPDRPHLHDYIGGMIDEFTPLAGDRAFSEDNAVIGGLGRFRGRSVLVIGHEKGADTQTRLKHNFGMARPEGYRKAIRLMNLAERFGLPVLTLVDTPGAYPGKGAEERGQAEAIARSTERCLSLGVPLVAAIVGEGGSGGAVALAAANAVLMFENAVYSVISPEGCASILWRSPEKTRDAAAALRLTAQDLQSLGVIDRIVPEPVGGAHRTPEEAIANLAEAFAQALDPLVGQSPEALRHARREKFLAMGRDGLA